MSSSYEVNDAIMVVVNRLENRAKMLRLVAQTKNKYVVDWNAMRDDINEGFDMVFDVLEPDDDSVLAEIEGEEELDTEPYPLDPDNEDNEWFEGFDDV